MIAWDRETFLKCLQFALPWRFQHDDTTMALAWEAFDEVKLFLLWEVRIARGDIGSCLERHCFHYDSSDRSIKSLSIIIALLNRGSLSV